MSFKKIIFVLLIVFILSGCEMPEFKGEVFKLGVKKYENATLGMNSIDTLNPLVTESEDYYAFSFLLYGSLFNYDKKGNLIPDLVEEFEYEDNIMHIILKDIDFNNGVSLTSRDVLFTIKTLQYAYINYGEDYLSSYILPIDNIRKAEAISDRELVIEFKEPYAFNEYLLTFPILSEKDFPYEGFEKYEKALSKENFSPNGTGDYSLETVSEKSLKLKGKDGAIISDLTVKFFEDEGLAEEELLRGSINFWKSEKKNIDKFKNSDKIYLLGFPSNECDVIAFNQESTMMKGNEGKIFRLLIKSILEDISVASKIYLDKAYDMSFPVLPPSFFSIENNLNSIEKDEINNLLKRFVDTDNDGFLEDAEGKKLFLRLVVNDDDFRKKVSELLKEELEKLGIELEILIVGENIDVFQEGEYQKLLNEVSNLKNCDMLYLGIELSQLPDPKFMPEISPDSKLYSFVSQDSQIEALIESYGNEVSGSEREKIAEEILKEVQDKIPYVFLTIQKHFIYSNFETELQTVPFYYRWCDFLTDD